MRNAAKNVSSVARRPSVVADDARTRTQPRMRETRNAPETTSPARARARVVVTWRSRRRSRRGHVGHERRRVGPVRGRSRRARMGAAVGGPEAGRRDVRVDLRRREALVAEQLLDDAQVRAAVEQVRRERVAERVGRDAVRQAGPAAEQVEPVAQAADAERPRRGGSGRPRSARRPACRASRPRCRPTSTGRPSSR